MREEKVKEYVGKVVILDLVMGQQLATRINKVENGVAHCGKLIMFHAQPVQGQNGQMSMNIQPIPYGVPLYKPNNTNEIDVGHIVFIFTPDEGMESAYTQVTSGIVKGNTAMLGAIDQAAKNAGDKGLIL